MTDPGGRLAVAVDGPVATVTIDNQAKRNAMTAGMWRALPPLLAALDADPAVRVLVLTGAGTTFCAGADIAHLADIGADAAPLDANASGLPAAADPAPPSAVPGRAVGEADTIRDAQPGRSAANAAVAAEEALAAVAKPTVAAIQGDCIGGGCQLALACDIRIAAAGSRFGITPARLGVIYPITSVRRLIRVAGTGAAQFLLLTAELVDADRALRMGLVQEVVQDMPARVAQLAATLAGRSLLSQVAMKQMIADPWLDPSRVHDWVSQVRDSGEAAEGAAAFLQRRTPSFPWKPTR